MTRNYHFAPETCKALETNLTIRIVLKAKYKLESRHSSRAIDWAEAHVAPHVARGLMREIGIEEDAFQIQVKMINLLKEKARAYICFDIFLNTCDEEKREKTTNSNNEPIHYMFYEGGDYYSRRAPNLDDYTRASFEECKSFDKGPEPYFSDLQNPPLYVNGIRREKPEHVRNEDWDGYGIIGRHVDELDNDTPPEQ